LNSSAAFRWRISRELCRRSHAAARAGGEPFPACSRGVGRSRTHSAATLGLPDVSTPNAPSGKKNAAQPVVDVPEQMRIRRDKRERLLSEGVEAYPVLVPRTHTLAEIRAAHPDLPADTQTGQIVGVAGRVIFVRNTGKLCFATLQEGDGTKLQAMIS